MDSSNNVFGTIFGMMVGIGIAAIFITFFIGFIFFAPKPYPNLKPVMKAQSHLEGVVQKKYWVGLLKSEWNFVNGLPEGPAYHFYPNGSLLRRMEYSGGRLNGEVLEFYEKRGQARGISRKYVKNDPPQIKIGAGDPKAVWNYVDGERHGAYVKFYLQKRIKEQGSYREGKLHGIVQTFDPQGQVKSKKSYRDGKLVSSDSEVMLDVVS